MIRSPFSAEEVEYDQASDTVTATGNVVASRNGYILRADSIVWNRITSRVTANGNIRSVGLTW